MIGRLCGRVVVEAPDGAVVLDVGGVGYELTTPLGAIGRAAADGELITLFVHTHVRQDAIDLFGFASEVERRVFRLLITVPNVGPKTAMNVLSALPPPELSRAVHENDLPRLNKIPGIGKKTAERIVLELKEKLTLVEDQPRAAGRRVRPDDAGRLLGALTNMGYRPAEAERAVRALGDRVGSEPLSDLLRRALAHLA
jgi:holliday junction DNA helicase RuvA